MPELQESQNDQPYRKLRLLSAAVVVLIVSALVVMSMMPPDPTRSDREFDSGSGIATQTLSELQIENLTLLGKVWGFAKYHHPRVTSGRIHWDYELLRILPLIMEANTGEEARRQLANWLRTTGDLQPCATCPTLPSDLHLLPGIEWIYDESRLGEELSGLLELIHGNRSAKRKQRYVSHARFVGNPRFSNEAAYVNHTSPDAGFRLLALYRYWNIIEYWFPYRDVIGEDWDGVLDEFLPRLMLAEGPDEYRLEMMQLIARVNDTHANLWSDLDLRPPRGPAELPVTFRFVEGMALVTGYRHAEHGPASGLHVGDVLLSIDGVPMDSLVALWRPYYAASNEPTRLRDIARNLTKGAAGDVNIRVQRGQDNLEVTLSRVPSWKLGSPSHAHDLPGQAFQVLADQVVYLKLSSARRRDIGRYLRKAAGAEVLVLDIRGYPRDFLVFSLGRRLVTEPTEFARFTRSAASHPGAFAWSDPLVLTPRGPEFSGTVVVLVNELTQSMAEYTAMALRASPNAVIVGSTTAGADGNVSEINLPGGLRTRISGIGVFYPDRTPTQRVGIIPDLEVRPTVAGVQAGRDEVLEEAVSHALGREFRYVPTQVRPDDDRTH